MKSLTAALQGVDVLVSMVAHTAIDNQTVLIDAAIAAGVKRFIPSEYASCSTNPKLETFPIYAPLTKIRHYLQEKAKVGELTWTVLACGAFLDFLFDRPLLLDFANHKATLFDEGDNRISCTSMPNIGRAIVGIVKNFEATKNRVMRTLEVILTQNKVLKIAEELRPDIKWEINRVQSSAVLKEGLDGISAGDFSMPVQFKILKGTAFAGDTYGSAYDETDNEVLCMQGLTEQDLRKLIAARLG